MDSCSVLIGTYYIRIYFLFFLNDQLPVETNRHITVSIKTNKILIINQ